MHKVWAVVRREFLERVRSRWFIISTVLGPVFMIGISVLPSVLATKAGRVNDIVLVSEGSEALADRVRTQLVTSRRFTVTILGIDPSRHDAVTDSLTRETRGDAIDGFLTLTAATLDAGTAEYRGRNVSSLRDMGVLERVVRSSLVIERLNRRGVDPAVVQEAQGRVVLKTLRISRRGATSESGEVTFVLGYIVAALLYMIILIYGLGVMRSVLEEKQTRIIEVLVSSLKPLQLMLGKVVGVGAVGLLQFSIWSGVGYLVVHFRRQILGWFHVPAQAVNAVTLPAVSGELVGVAILFFLLGYLLYSSLFAVVGASVNTDSEAQQAQQPVMWLLILSFVLSFAALADPAGRLAVTASLVPFSAPIMMPVRVATSDVRVAELALSVAIMAATALLVVWGAARIYRIGILMYGKRPSMKELWRWARQS